MPTDPRDKLDVESLGNRDRTHEEQEPLGPRRRFLSILFNCCNTYGRLYMNEAKTQYRGRCPSCGAEVRARIGPGGTDKRLFETS